MELMGFQGWKMIIPIIVALIVIGITHLIFHPNNTKSKNLETTENGGKE